MFYPTQFLVSQSLPGSPSFEGGFVDLVLWVRRYSALPMLSTPTGALFDYGPSLSTCPIFHVPHRSAIQFASGLLCRSLLSLCCLTPQMVPVSQQSPATGPKNLISHSCRDKWDTRLSQDPLPRLQAHICPQLTQKKWVDP